MRNTILVTCTTIIVSLHCHAQVMDRFTEDISHREIILNREDSMVRFNVLINYEKIKIKNDLTYYWYFADHIKHNRGGYAGSLLQGEYKVFDRENNLIEKGYFKKGLKHDEWKQWYFDGTLRSVQFWESGRETGVHKFYDSEGKLIKEMEYSNGLLHGKTVQYAVTDTVTTIYRKGDKVEEYMGNSILHDLFNRDNKQ